MERRTFESPMDWEYQNSGPLDPTSPFVQSAQRAQNNSQFCLVSHPQKTPFLTFLLELQMHLAYPSQAPLASTAHLLALKAAARKN